MILLTKLFLAHILGDFVLQPKTWVKQKRKHKLKSAKLYIHIGIHLTLMLLLVWDIKQWPLIITITGLHFVIDAVKLLFQKKRNRRPWFFIDQMLHIISIVLAYVLFMDIFFFEEIPQQTIWFFITCMIFLTQPVSIIMKTIFAKWHIEKLTKNNQSLTDAGKYIGILERLLVFVFIITNHWEAVGFLITAKSVFRFGDLRDSKQRKLTEYILIGTLISFSFAIAVGLLFNLLHNIN